MKSNLYFGIILLSLFFSVCEITSAQSPDWLWAKAIGGTGDDFGYSMAIDPSGSGEVYTTGSFSGTVDFDPGEGIFNLTGGGIFISKLDGSGNFAWAKAMDGYGVGYSITLDPAGGGSVYTTGFFSGTVDFDPGEGVFNLTAASSDIFISKLDMSGNFIWAKAMGGTSSVYGFSIAHDPTGSGEIYTTGYFTGTADFDPGKGTFNLTSAGVGDIFISKLDGSGNFVWAKAMAGTQHDNSHSIAVDPADGVYITGFFRGTVDFDPGEGIFNLTSAGSSDIFISKLDGSGNFVWAKAMGGGIDVDDGYSIAVDPAGSGAVYTTGSFMGTVDFNPGAGVFNLTSAGSYDIFISKLDGSGNFVWAKAMGGATYADGGRFITLDPAGSGDVYTSGYFTGTVDFDPGAGIFNLTSVGSYDIFISKLDGSGNFVWAKAVGGTSGETYSSIALDVSGNVNMAGSFQSDFITFGSTTLTNANSSGYTNDIFIAKLGPCSGIVTNTSDSGIGSLRDKILCAPSGAIITFDGGLMDQTITLTSGEININKDLTLSGLGILNLTISGNNAFRIFHLLPGKNLEIKNLSLKNSTAVTNGGAIFVEGNLTLENILMQNNFENGIPKGMTIISPGGLVTIIENVDIKN